MNSITMKKNTHVLGMSVVILMLSYNASGQKNPVVIDVTQQDRHINSWVWISGCPQETQSANAADTGPFDATVAIESDCPVGTGNATASQNSAIHDNGFAAQGNGSIYVGAPQTVIHAMGRSRFEVTFELAEARRYNLTGVIEASRHGNTQAAGTIAYTTLMLNSGGDTLYGAIVEPPLNQSQQTNVSSVGLLQPGTYRIHVTSNTFVDQWYNNTWFEGDVGYQIDLAFTHPADITTDGVVNINDLLAVINGWGVCPGQCPPICDADATGDCAVNVNDLLLVINNWG